MIMSEWEDVYEKKVYRVCTDERHDADDDSTEFHICSIKHRSRGD